MNRAGGSGTRVVAAAAVAVLVWMATTACAQQPDRVDFSFDQVDIPTFARLVGDITGRKFVVADDIKRKITIVSPRVSRAEVYALFVSILESAGCSVVRDGDLHRIVALPRGSAVMAPVVPQGEALPADGLVTRVLRLEHVAAASVQKLLQQRLGAKSAAVAAIDETNHLVITDSARSIRRIEAILEQIDQPGMARMTEVVALKYANAEDLARQLNAALEESATRAQVLRDRLPALRPPRDGGIEGYAVASGDSNTLILVGTSSQIALLKDIIGKMDIDVPSGRGRLNAIFLKYIQAEEAAKSLNALLEKSGAGGEKGAARRIAIEASAANNALLVHASPGDFDVVKRLIAQLDSPREQVHIEVLIAEVSRSDDFNLGVDMAAVDLPGFVGETVIQGSSTFREGAESVLNQVQQGLFPRGITVGAAHGTRLDAEGRVVSSYPALVNIDAVKRDGHFKVLSETALETQNNREASVSIVNEIPVLQSTVQAGSGTARDIIQNIERVDVGIKLKLTPHVIPDGLVQMELNPSIEAVVEPESTGQALTPTIARREVNTTVTVRDGQMIIIAGLTRQDKKEVVRRVPLLGSIPLLGWLFRHRTESTENTDLLIFVTPHIVGEGGAGRIAERWREKTGIRPDESR